MTQTKAVLIFGACVMAASIGLYMLMMGGDDEAPAATQSKPTEPPPPVTPASPPTPPPTLASDDRAGAPVVATSDEPRDIAEPVKEYELDGRKVRDHRSGDRKPIDIPPAVHPPEGRKIPPTLTSDIGQKVRAKVTECAAQLPREARGDKPRVEGLVVIAIKDKQVVVTSATVQVRNVADGAADPVKQCIEAGALAVTGETTEDDLASYDVTVSYAL